MKRYECLNGRLVLWITTFFIACVSTPSCAQDSIAFYTTRTISLTPAFVVPHVTSLPDSLASDTVYQTVAANGVPVSYHRYIQTSVCFDNKCRILSAIVHWNVTGRYLGFELPPGEFLSKAEHTPFTHSEYLRLHALLMDPNSPLANISYNELVPQKRETGPDIDAVSAPTSRALSDFVVEGAAYTTYKLWHIIHGTSREEISRLTVDVLTPGLMLKILQSADPADKIWALDHKRYIKEAGPLVKAAVLSLIGSNQFSLAERAVQSIDSADMQDENFQLTLLQKLDSVNYSLKKILIHKFTLANGLSSIVADSLAKKLEYANGEIVGSILHVFKDKNIENVQVFRKVAMLLDHPNVFISKQAFDFLTRGTLQDQHILKRLDMYRQKHKP